MFPFFPVRALPRRLPLSVSRVLLLVALAFACTTGRAQPAASQFTVLRAMSRDDGSGVRITSRLIQGSNGLLYGVRQTGGGADGGTLFRIGTDGTGFSVLRHFTTQDGTWPVAIVQSRDGALYGTSDGTGPGPLGTIFKLNLDGTGFTILHRFTHPSTGWSPGMLLEGSDGFLYGACLGDGRDNYSSPAAIFRVARDGTGFRLLRTLNRATEGSGANGLASVQLIQGPDGRLYGTAAGGGAGDSGTIFRLNLDGSDFTVLRQLTSTEGRQPNRLTYTRGGKLFGTAFLGGQYDLGSIFRLDPDGNNFSVIKHLAGNFPPPITSQRPWCGLTEANDGLLYGVSTRGGDLREYGTLYRINPADGTYTLLRALEWTDGASPGTDLLLANNGRLYGTTGSGGALAHGTIFSYSLVASTAVPEGVVGQPFSYSISALLGSAASYSAQGLPTGLSVNSSTGAITGTPQQAGTFALTLTASTSGGTAASATVQLVVAKAPVTITLSNLTQSYDGRPKPVTATVSPGHVAVTITYNGSLTAPTSPGTYSVAAISADPNYEGTATGTLTITGSAPLITTLSPNPSVVAGTAVTLQATVSAVSPARFQWQRKPAGAAEFADLSEGNGYTGVGTATLAIAATTFAMHGDQFRLVVTNALGSATSEPIFLTVHPAAVLTNVAIRARVTADEPLTVGFVTSGPRSVLIRAVGPGLAPFVGETAVARDPTLVLTDRNNVRLASNNDWGGTPALATAFASVGAFPLPNGSQDAALLTPVNGSATTQMSVSATGLGLIEVYDAGTGPGVRVVNLSALYRAGSGADALVAGFMVSGAGTKRLLVRGIGPALRGFGLANALADARLEIFTANGALLVANDDWAESLAPAFVQAGAFALTAGSKDAALILNVPTGSYTAQLSSGDGTAGPGLIEIYELP